jgi:anaerobic selenocysteine-containing dehydrogenase
MLQPTFEREVKTTCRICLCYCGIVAKRKNNKIELQGDPCHPLSKGFLCVKGRSALQIATSPKRLLHPLVRKGNRGSGRWKRISWDKAIRAISQELGSIIKSYGPEAVTVNCLPPKDFMIWEAFAKAIGTPNFFKHNLHQCFTPQILADYVTFGDLITYLNLSHEDASHVGTIVLWGVNPTATSPSKGAVIEGARKNAKLIVVDPRPIPLAKRADLWLRVRPGSDCALALGMLNYMIGKKLYDENFVKNWVFGFDKLCERVRHYPLSRVSEITWVKEDDIKKAVDIMVSHKPTAIYTFLGLAMNGNGFNTYRAIGLIIALLGCIDMRGGNMIKHPPPVVRRGFEGGEIFRLPEQLLAKQLSAESYPFLSGKKALTPFPHPWDVISAMSTGKPYPVKALITGCNPLASLEDGREVLKALMNLDLLVVLELFMTPTAEYADFVLPVTTFLEADGVSYYTGMNFVAARNKCIEPLGEAKDEVEILLSILKRMRLDEKLPFKTKEEYLDFLLKPEGITFRELSDKNYILEPYEERKHEKGLLRKDRNVGFNTSTGKVEVMSKILASFGYDPLPDYKEPPRSPYSTPHLFEKYPYILVTGARNIANFNGLGLQVKKLRQVHPYPTVEISPNVAKSHGLKEGDWVYIEVPGFVDKVKMRTCVTEGLDDRVVCAEALWYLPEQIEQEKRIWGSNINAVTPKDTSNDAVLGTSTARALLCNILPAK